MGENEDQCGTLRNTVRIFSNDTGIELGLNKGAILKLKQEKVKQC